MDALILNKLLRSIIVLLLLFSGFTIIGYYKYFFCSENQYILPKDFLQSLLCFFCTLFIYLLFVTLISLDKSLSFFDFEELVTEVSLIVALCIALCLFLIIIYVIVSRTKSAITNKTITNKRKLMFHSIISVVLGLTVFFVKQIFQGRILLQKNFSFCSIGDFIYPFYIIVLVYFMFLFPTITQTIIFFDNIYSGKKSILSTAISIIWMVLAGINVFLFLIR